MSPSRSRCLNVGLAAAVCVVLGWPLRAGPATDDLPPAPQWVGAREVRGSAVLTWVMNPEFRMVRVYRREEGEPEVSPRGETSENTFRDLEVYAGKAYYYQLRGVSAAGREGPPSMEISLRIVAEKLLPAAPPEWLGFLQAEDNVNLRWSEQPGHDVIAYNVYRREAPDPQLMLIGSTRSPKFRDEGLVLGRTYVYVLTALDSELRETDRSPELEVSLLPPSRLGLPSGAPPAWKVRRTKRIAVVWRGGEEALLRPADVAVGPVTGRFYLSDSGGRRIFIFSPSGTFEGSIGKPAEGEGGNLLGLSLDANENLYGVDAAHNAVQVFGRAGRPGVRLEVPPARLGQHWGIVDAAVGPAGEVFVVDNAGDRILAFSGLSATPATVGVRGAGPGQFSAPTFCALGPAGALYVSDTLNARVQVLGPSGEFVRSFGSYVRGPGGFGRPKGIAVSPAGEVYVADSWFNTVQVFDREGAFVALLGDEEGRPLDLGSPNGIALGRGGRTLGIAERLASRFQIVEILDEQP